jgi:hypothetical protein
MLYRLLADAVVMFHMVFVAFAVAGGLLAFWRGWIVLLHLPALGWAAFVEFTGRSCPLTPLENTLRAASGAAGYEGGFIEHYLLPVLYPAALTRELQWTLGTGLVAFNLVVYLLLGYRARRRAGTPGQTLFR